MRATLVFLETVTTGQKEIGRIAWDGKKLSGPKNLIDEFVWPLESPSPEEIEGLLDQAESRYDGRRCRAKLERPGKKGGPGSGHHRHPGRPGEVGGSKPTGRAPEEAGKPRASAAPKPQLEQGGEPKPRTEPKTETEPEVRVGITSDRPGKEDTLVLAEMREFIKRMKAAGIKNLKVIFGRGGWDGGGEATWVTSYDGDGEAKRIILEAAREYDQDAVLFMYRAEEGEAGASPKTSFRFSTMLSDQEIELVEVELKDRKVGGWTWYNGTAGSRLMVANVPQWTDRSGDEHSSVMDGVLGDLQGAGFGVQSQTSWLRAEVIERNDYDLLLGTQ